MAHGQTGSGRTYVLVHGAWHGGWVWKDVATILRAAGHVVTAPTMTGLGEREHLLSPDIDLDTHVEDIVNHVEMEDLSDIVLVGWSYGGTVAVPVISRIADRLRSRLLSVAPSKGTLVVTAPSVSRGPCPPLAEPELSVRLPGPRPRA